MYINPLSFICSCIWHLGLFHSLAMMKSVAVKHDCHIYTPQRLSFLSLCHSKPLSHSLISWGPTCNFSCSLSRWNFIQKVMIYANILEYSYFFFSLSLHFRVSGLKLRFGIHLKLLFLLHKRWGPSFSLSTCRYHILPTLFADMAVFSLMYIFGIFIKTRWF